MAENKTKATAEDVASFIELVPDENRRADARALCAIMERATGEPARMWGTSIVGFGRYRYRYDSGREGEGAPVGFSPRTKELVLYLAVHSERTPALLARLGKHKEGKSCVYVKRLADLDEAVLEELIADTCKAVFERYPRS
ncbi:MAG TPA: DUF1801 domain-containing protein [Allosphingosinicella sp.]|nr:DUF1801 domain-containing protein [Allosphingosinicella sp.]